MFVNSKDHALTCQFDRAGIKESKPKLKECMRFPSQKLGFIK